MSKLIPVSYETKPCYDILLEQNFQMLLPTLQKIGYASSQKVCIVTDSNIASLYLEELTAILQTYFGSVISFSFPAGEENTTLFTVQNLYQTLIEEHFERRDILLAFGGGVTGDLTGFAAATYLRGIDFIQIPTSLLSQVDSSIGGKTGVDFSQYKNMVGAFYQPKLVYMNLSLLATLPKEQFVSGMGEIIKHGLIRSKGYFDWISKHTEQIVRLEPNVIEELIYESCLIKRGVVERDPKENGERALLNFGHTVGHAIEKLSDFRLSHGQCVGLGMAAACRISFETGKLAKDAYEQVSHILQEFGLPVSVSHLSAADILAVSKSDKKMSKGKIKFILLDSIGSAYIETGLSDVQILSGISGVLN